MLQQRIDELSLDLSALTAERDEAMQRERALAEVLEAINASAQVPTAVFDVILEKVMRLCAAAFGYLMTYDGERFQVVASHSLPARFAEYLRNMAQPGSSGLLCRHPSRVGVWSGGRLAEGEVYRTSHCAGLWSTSVGRGPESWLRLERMTAALTSSPSIVRRCGRLRRRGNRAVAELRRARRSSPSIFTRCSAITRKRSASCAR
jgi:hypothetical protein